MIVPPGYQVAAPFGSSIGPVNSAFFAVMPDCQFDSFLTIGMDNAATAGALSQVGLPLEDWSETKGFCGDNGAVFFMDPDDGQPGPDAVMLQLSVPTGTQFSGQLSAQGRSSDGDKDWDVKKIVYSSSAVTGVSGGAGGLEAPEALTVCPLASDTEIVKHR